MTDTISGSRSEARAAFDDALNRYGSRQYCYHAPTNYPYAGTLSYYWCAAFVVYQLVAAGLDLRKKIALWAYCPAVESYMYASPDWITTAYTNAQDGDIILFKRNGVAYHIGMVDGPYNASTGCLPTREGDTSNDNVRMESGVGGCYARKQRYMPNYTSGGYSVHIFRHTYLGTTPAPAAAKTTSAAAANVLTVGSSGTRVAHLQAALNKVFPAYTSGGLTVDGQYGQLTAAAVKKFQAAAHIAADGVTGPATLAALAKYGITNL